MMMVATKHVHVRKLCCLLMIKNTEHPIFFLKPSRETLFAVQFNEQINSKLFVYVCIFPPINIVLYKTKRVAVPRRTLLNSVQAVWASMSAAAEAAAKAAASTQGLAIVVRWSINYHHRADGTWMMMLMAFTVWDVCNGVDVQKTTAFFAEKSGVQRYTSKLHTFIG